MPASSTQRRKFVTVSEFAKLNFVQPRTVRNWISKGIISGYRRPGSRVILVDLAAADAALKMIPTTRARPGSRVLNGNVKTLPVEPVVGDGQ